MGISQKHQNQSGLSLLEVLISIGLLMLVSMGSLSLIVSAKKGQSELQERLNYASTYQMAQTILNRTQECSCQFTGRTFDSTNTNPSFLIDELKVSCGPADKALFKSPTSSSTDPSALVVTEIAIEEIEPTGNSEEFVGKLRAKPKQSAALPISPIPLLIRFYTSPTSPANNKLIVACGAAPLSTPANIQRLPGNAQCALSWNPSSGAGPITYVARYSTTAGQASNGIVGCQTTSQSCLVNGLINGTAYYFSLAATNPYETSPASTEVTCTPTQPITAPSPTANGIAPNQCSISWGPSAGTPIISYTTKHSSTFGQSANGTTACSGQTTNCVKSGLAAGTTHYFTVVASNAFDSVNSPEISCYVPIGNCTTPWGATVTHGSSVTAYQAPGVPFGNTCLPETRFCNSTFLSGSYGFASCSVAPPPATPSPTPSVTPSPSPSSTPSALTWKLILFSNPGWCLSNSQVCQAAPHNPFCPICPQCFGCSADPTNTPCSSQGETNTIFTSFTETTSFACPPTNRFCSVAGKTWQCKY